MQKNMDDQYLLDWAKELSQDNAFWDFHAHPFCVLSGNTNYQLKKNVAGLYSTCDSVYHCPKNEPETQKTTRKINFNSNKLSESALLLSSRLIYTFSGPKVFTDYTDAIGISNVLLLPLIKGDGDVLEILDAMVSMFSADSRFAFGCPIPQGFSLQDQKKYFESSKNKYNIQCIKVHPNFSGIDPISKEGELFLSSVLENASELRLPILVHGGRTPGVTPVENREFGTLARLSKINWSISSYPVVIAHAGCYGLEFDELDSTIRILKDMLELHPNLLVDTSALDEDVLQILMNKIDRKRFVFGSDALYFSIWSGWVSLLRVLTSLSSQPEDDLILIASTNPQTCLPSHD
jgi:predicted TIM-barrel fold metal-dependent hydrolase